jgi:glucose-1-phosphate cytidylyltransferase
MKSYAHHGINEFLVLCGYKSEVIKDYFATYHLRKSDVTFDLKNHTHEVHRNGAEDWKVTLIETGDESMTGGRLKRVKEYLGAETFCFTYGDGVTDLDISATIAFHQQQQVLATVTAIQPPGRFGVFTLSKDQSIIRSFREKPEGDGAWINGGYFVMEPEVIDYIENDYTVFEQEPMQKLAANGQLAAYKHTGFWQNMDTLRDKNLLEKLWQSGEAPWQIR